MAIVAGDIKFKLSTKTGTGGNQTGSTPAESLGKYISTTEITSAQLNNLFDDITGDENAASDVEYRCFFIHNAHATLALENVRVWFSGEASVADIDIAETKNGFPANLTKPIGQAAAQAEEIADESTAPTGLTFYHPTTKATGFSISPSALEAGYCVPFWLKRTASDSVAKANDSITVKIEGDTAA